MRKFIPVFVALAFAAAAFAYYLLGRGTAVVVAVPERGTAIDSVYATGIVEPVSWAQVSSLVPGRLADIRVHDGDRVEDGQLLARLGFVFQLHFLLEEFDVPANVMLPMRKLGRLTPADMRAKAEVILADFGLADQMKKYPNQLSGGQRQRVAVARARANDPAIVFADEPTGNLDSQNALAVFGIFKRLAREQGRALVVVTHEPDLAAMADRRIQMIDGRIATT